MHRNLFNSLNISLKRFERKVLRTVKLVLRDHSHERPLVLKDHIFPSEGHTFQSNWTCHHRPPLETPHLYGYGWSFKTGSTVYLLIYNCHGHTMAFTDIMGLKHKSLPVNAYQLCVTWLLSTPENEDSGLLIWNCTEWNQSWETTAVRDHLSCKTRYSWQKVPHFGVIDPVTKDHLSWETTFLCPMGHWSFKTGSTVHVINCLGQRDIGLL